jgi:carbon-monoxide dehydrogenase small subunit
MYIFKWHSSSLFKTMKAFVSFILNGKPVTIETEKNRSLLWVLRTEFDLTGAKYGCGEGFCGSCTVLVDNAAMQSCQLTLEDVEGSSVLTIEGLGENGNLHPLQEAFLDEEALQCGYCTPGMILTAVSLMHRNPDPSEDEILEAMGNNLCRCGSYHRIVTAIRTAALRLKSTD